jgi:hypothetical protein
MNPFPVQETLQRIALEIQLLQSQNFSSLEKDLRIDALYERCARLADALDILEQNGTEIAQLEQAYIEILMRLSQLDEANPSSQQEQAAKQQTQMITLLELMPPIRP